ncbi:hypothetical protein [Lyngbya aestuarii]|uniref:hypothetical protein n=1 Tax=Lyngbya aestuarii TaxID=118322 RepID=UPI00403DFD84
MTFSTIYSKNVKIFFAYSAKDERMRQDLEEHLYHLSALGVETKWYNYQNESQNELVRYLDTTNLIILLVSPSFMHEFSRNEPYWKAPIQLAKEKNEQPEVPHIPVLLRQVDNWQSTLGDLAPLPINGKAVNETRFWANSDEAYVAISQGIGEIVKNLKDYRKKLQQYEQYFHEAIQREYPLSEYDREWLNNFKLTNNLKDRDTDLIEEEFRQSSQKYKQYLISFLEKFLRARYSISLGKRQSILIVSVVVVFLSLVGLVSRLLIASPNKQQPGINTAKFNKIANLILIPSTNDEGWIFLGIVNKSSPPIYFEEPLVSGSSNINVPFIPNVETEVTVTQNVELRKNMPQKPNFNAKEQEFLGKLKSGEKIIIRKVETFLDKNSTPPVTEVWAEISRCGNTCN